MQPDGHETGALRVGQEEGRDCRHPRQPRAAGKVDLGVLDHKMLHMSGIHDYIVHVQGDPYGRGIVYVDSKFEVAFRCKVGLLPRPVMEL